MKVFFIRHGETIDNVAQLYAGSRDSELTNHGVLQATRLGQYLKSTDVALTHIFSSHLKRAARTANIIREAQDGPTVCQTPLITEKDFGSSEGKPWGKQVPQDLNETDNSFIPSETRNSMDSRAYTFLDTFLVPLLTLPSGSKEPVLAIVSHGIILSVLWKCLLRRLPPKSVQLSPELVATRSVTALEHLGRWDNTGYLELRLTRNLPRSDAALAATSPLACSREKTMASSASHRESSEPVEGALDSCEGPSANSEPCEPTPSVSTPDQLHSHLEDSCTVSELHKHSTFIQRVNSRDHLKNLKRTRGGVGSAEYDANQKSIHSFFKKARTS